MLEQMGQENSRLMEALKTKDEESGQYMALLEEMRKKINRSTKGSKEAKKYK